MKLGPAVHGALLVIALLIAYQGWSKDETKKPDIGTVEVWSHDPGNFKGIAFEAERKSVRASWKTQGDDRYLWGEVTRSVPKRRMGKKKGEPEELETRTRNFPVDVEKGEEMVGNFSNLKALSALGKLDDDKKKEYGLAESKDNLSVSFANGQENLIIGSRVYGGSDRYVLHAESGNAYVISKDVLRPLEAGETSLRLKKVHGYEDSQVHKVKVDSKGETKELVKTEVKDEKGTREAWAYAGAPDKADLTLDSFLDRAGKLRPTEYLTEDPGAELVVRISERGRSGKELGYMEFYRKVPPELMKTDGEEEEEGDEKDEDGVPDALADPDQKDESEGDDDGDEKGEADKPDKPPEIEYYIRTERTRSWGKVSRLAAERFDQDVASLFEREAPPTTPVPERKPRRPGARPGMPGHGGHGMPGRPGAVPGRPGAVPGRPGAARGRPGAVPGRPGAVPGRPGAVPGRPGAAPGRPGARPTGKPDAKPGKAPAPKKSAPEKAPSKTAPAPAGGE